MWYTSVSCEVGIAHLTTNAGQIMRKRKMHLANGGLPLSAEKSHLFEKFYTEHYPLAFGYLNKLLQNADDAYDVLTHSFELALARFDEYLSHSEQRYWFFGILRNSASYFLRRRVKDAHAVLPAAKVAASPEEILLQREEASLISRALAALPEKYREVAILRFQDFSYKEIAAMLAISVEAAESRMRRAIVKLEPFYAEFKENMR